MKTNFLNFLICFLFMTVSVFGQTGDPIFTPGDPINGGIVSGGNFEINGGYWPDYEAPLNAIDGFGQKYYNTFSNVGILVTPSNGTFVANEIKIWTANDVIARDPASFEIYGTNNPISGSAISMNSFTFIASGSLSLPDTRNAGGTNPLDDANSQLLSFQNTSGFASYLIIFPTNKSGGSSDTQIAEVQLYGSVYIPVPTIGQWGLIILGLFMVIFAIAVVNSKKESIFSNKMAN